MAELQPPEGQINGGALLVSPTVNVATKRQRRPSVRLGDIGDQTYDPHGRRRTKQWKAPMNEAGVGVGGGKSSRTRAIMNFASSSDNHEALDGEDKEGYMDSVAVGSWKIRDSKSKRASTKRVRSNWAPKVDETGGGTNEGEEKYSGGEDVDDGFRDFDVDGSESPLKEQSPIHTLDNMAIDIDRADLHRRGVGATRVSEVRDHQDELEGPSDTDTRNWINPERNGVRVWLNQLGLGRYAPVFEIHEVDDEVLPMLTIEDLKDMGINAVGSRRKMYCSIQKLSKGFS